MTKKRIAQAIKKIEKAKRKREQAALASRRKIARLRDQARKARTRILIQVGAQFLAIPNRALTTPEVQNLRIQAEEDLDGIQQALDLEIELSAGKRRKSEAKGSQQAQESEDAPEPVGAGLHKIVLGFRNVPPEDLRRELGKLQLGYGKEKKYHWTGKADPDTVRARIHEFGADHLVKVFDVVPCSSKSFE